MHSVRVLDYLMSGQRQGQKTARESLSTRVREERTFFFFPGGRVPQEAQSMFIFPLDRSVERGPSWLAR